MQRPPAQQQPQQGQAAQQQEQLQKLITAANAGQLSHEQLSQLRLFLSSQGGTAAMGLQPLAGNASGNSNSSNANINMQMPGMPTGGIQQQQSPPQQQLVQQQQQQMTQSPAPQYQNLNQSSNTASSASSNAAPGNPDPRALIAQLQNRIANIDTVLKRTDISDQDRNRLSQELENNKRSLAAFVNQVKVAAAAQHQMQSMQNAGQGSNVNEMQMAQQRAMAQKAQQIQAQMQQQQQIPHQAAQMNFQQQLSNNGGLNLTLPPNPAARSSPSMQAQQLPHQMQAPNNTQQQQQQMSPMPQQQSQQMPLQRQPPPQFQQNNQNQQQPPVAANTASPAMSASSPPNVNTQLQNNQANQGKRRQQAPHLQQQTSSQGGSRATPQPAQQHGQNQNQSQMMQQQQTQQQSMQMQQQQQQAPQPPPSTVSASSTIPPAQPSFSIPESLSMPTTQPEPFPASRPTLSSGTATNPILSAPAVTAAPLANLPSTRTTGVGGPSQPSATGSNAASGAATPQASTSAAPSHGGPAPALGQPGPLALKNAEGRPYNKRKLQELVASIDPNQQLEAQVEDLLLEVADDFIDNVTRFACRLAKHRKSDRLECRDLNLVLDRTYNMQIPGFGSDEIKSSGTNRRTHLPAYQARLAAIRGDKKGN